MGDSRPDLMRDRECADLVLMSTKALGHMRQRGEGPPFIRIGRTIRYSRKEVGAWLREQTVRPEGAA